MTCGATYYANFSDPSTACTVYRGRKAQPQGLKNYQAKKAAAEAEKLAPYTVEKEYYSYNVILNGEIVNTFEKKGDAVAWIMTEKARPETISTPVPEQAAPETVQEERPETISTPEKKPETVQKKGEKTMKFEKIDYSILGHFENGQKYGIATRQSVSGYTAQGLDGIAFRKVKNFWYVDHIPTGLAIITVGSKTREAALNEYNTYYAEKLQNATKTFLAGAIERFEKAPFDTEVAAWETVNYCTTRNWRFDKVHDAARRAGLLIRKADNITYMDGGNIDIIGSPKALKDIRAMVEEFTRQENEKIAAEAAALAQEAEKAAPAPEAVQEERPETISTPAQAPEAEKAAPETVAPETVAPEAAPRTAPEKPARAAAKEKAFAGEALTGRGWSIVFDTGLQRTRVIVQDGIREKAAPIIENAGFYYSKNMNSWNKKLTHKAHRAAVALADALRAALA